MTIFPTSRKRIDMDRIAIYIRVSTVNQSLESQQQELERWCGSYVGPSDSVEWFTDHWSGKSMDRAGWKQLKKRLDSGDFDRLVVWRLDRLGRTASGLVTLFEELNNLGVDFVSVKDGIDLGTPAGRLMAHVLASVAAYETEVRADRVRAGIAAAKAQGKRWGGSKAGERRRLTDEQLEQASRLSGNGCSVGLICQTVGISRSHFYRLRKSGAIHNDSFDGSDGGAEGAK